MYICMVEGPQKVEEMFRTAVAEERNKVDEQFEQVCYVYMYGGRSAKSRRSVPHSGSGRAELGGRTV